jgi:hypothetical protein
LTGTTIALTTLQFFRGIDDYAVHLVRTTSKGTPGPTLCGIGRFAGNAPSWALGSGTDGPGITHKPCPDCADTARQHFPGIGICGRTGGAEMAAELGVEVIRG